MHFKSADKFSFFTIATNAWAKLAPFTATLLDQGRAMTSMVQVGADQLYFYGGLSTLSVIQTDSFVYNVTCEFAPIIRNHLNILTIFSNSKHMDRLCSDFIADQFAIWPLFVYRRIQLLPIWRDWSTWYH